MTEVAAITLPLWAFLLQLLIVGVAIGVIVGTILSSRPKTMHAPRHDLLNDGVPEPSRPGRLDAPDLNDNDGGLRAD